MGNSIPVNIRRNVVDTDDPYLVQESYDDFTTCSECGSVYASGRWYPKGHFSAKEMAGSKGQTVQCAACRRLNDNVPGGVLKITGTFVPDHKDEILNLVRNESAKAMGLNQLHRVMSLEWSREGDLEITTTHDKLAERIGRALHKAYSGVVEYQWSGESKMARVNWHRDI